MAGNSNFDLGLVFPDTDMLSDFFKDSDACVEAELLETFAQNKTVNDLTDDEIQHFLSENKSKSIISIGKAINI